MNVIDKIKQKFIEYPSVQYKCEGNTIFVPKTNKNGFNVSLENNEGQFYVSYDGWHENFEVEKEAINCFGFGLTNNCRLVVHSKGKFEYKWIVQFLSHKEWHDDSTTGLIFYPFWRRTRIIYRLNNHIPSVE